jgi:Uma2 family endonuclease
MIVSYVVDVHVADEVQEIEPMTIDPQWQDSPPGGPMSVEEYFELDNNTFNGRYEYIDGVARLMAGGSAEHNRIALNVYTALNQEFLSGPCTVFGLEMRTLVGKRANGKEQYYYPDVTISCDVADRRRGNKLIRSPRVVVEVLSPSTEKLDRGTKLKNYKTVPSIQEIVLIDQFTQAAEVYHRDGEDGTTWSHAFYGPDQVIELQSVDVFIPMDEVYKGVNFDEPLVEE